MHGRSVLILLGLLALLLSLSPLGAATGTPAKQGVPDKIEPLVLEELAANGQTDYFVWMAKKADLSPAEQLQTKLEKGRFVYETLRATAERTQAPLRAYLDQHGVNYQAFYIANKILVRGGDESLLLQIAARPGVARITANHEFRFDEPLPSANPSPHTQAIEPNIAFVKADLVWAIGITGTGTVLASNDTGMDEAHPALARHYRGCLNPPTCSIWDHNYNWWDPTGTYPTNPADGHGHGTRITGILVGDDGGTNQIGMAPGAQVIHCKLIRNNNTSNEGIIDECFQWDLAPWDLSGANPRPDLAPDAIHHAWGATGNPTTFEDEIAALQAAGILIEFSAGNGGPGCGTIIKSPSNYRQVLTTGSVNHTAPYPGTITGSSSRGPSVLYPDDYFPDIMAPGQAVRSSIPGGGYAPGSGTSYAGPHVAGLVGLLWSANPALRGQVALTTQIIKDTAAPLTGQGGSNCGGNYDVGPNNDWGYGTIDALAAVTRALSLGSDLAYLDGTVSDTATALPLSGAQVAIFDAYGFLWGGRTNASGYYTLSLAPGTFTVTASAFGYISETVGSVVVITDTTSTQDFSLTALPAYVISGTVTEAGTGSPLSATVTIYDTPIPPTSTDPATGFYSLTVPSGRYRLVARAAGYVPLDRDVVADHDQTQHFEANPPRCILLVDGDQDNPDTRIYYTETLDVLGYAYDVWNVATFGDPAAEDLMAHRIVLWYTGALFLHSFNSQNEIAAAAYLEAGGNLFLSDHTYLYAMRLTPFGQYYLGITSFTADIEEMTVIGNPGNPIGDGLGPYYLGYPPSWPYLMTNYVNGVQAPFRWQASGQSNSTNYDAGHFKTVYLGWPLEGLYHNPDARAEILEAVLDWFGGCCIPVEGADFSWMPPTPTVGEAVALTGTIAAGMEPISYTWDLGDGTMASAAHVSHTYTAAGDYTVVMTATNCATSTAVASHTITVGCDPVEAVAIAGPGSLRVGETGSYSATCTPITATAPVNYTWDNGTVGPTAAYSWTMPGSYTITVTATNTCGAVQDTFPVEACQAVEAAAVQGPAALVVGQTGLYTASYAPITATAPVTFTWDNGAVGPTVGYSWTLPGAYTITVTATNACGWVSRPFVVDVSLVIYEIYLPLVLRGR